jgi:hypothetical protein
MTKPELDFYETKGWSIFMALFCSVGLFVNIRVFKWSASHSNIGSVGLTLIVLLLAIYNWLKYFNKKPTVKIRKEGLWLRNGVAFFAKERMISWDKINYYYLKNLSFNKGGHSLSLMIGLKGRDKEKNLDITSTKHLEELQDALHAYGSSYNFSELEKISA